MSCSSWCKTDTMPTLAEVLATPSLDLRVHVPGDAPVRWVATSELADPTPYLEGGEILLTTGLTTPGWDTEWEPYAVRLVAAGVVALGLGVGLTHASVPPALLRAAAAAGLPLFTVPQPVPFVAVTREVGRLVEREEQRALRSAAALQRRLTRAAMAPDGPAAILRTLATIVDGSARICGPDGAGLDPEVFARLRSAGLRGSHSASGPGGSTLVQPLGPAGPPRGYLLVTGPRPWDAAHHGAVATAVALLSLDAERRADARTAAREIRAGGWALLLAGATDSAVAVLGLRAAAAGSVDGQGRFHVLRLRGEAALAAAEGWAAGDRDVLLSSPVENGDTVVVVREEAGPQLRGVADDGHAATGPGRAHPWARAGGEHADPEHADEGDPHPPEGSGAAPDPLSRLAARGVRVGVGAPEPLARVAASDATAVAALARTSTARPVARWSDVVDHGLVALLDGPTGEAFARRVLGPLAEPGHDDLHATMEQFHTHHGQLTVVAAALGVHRNTGRRRLRRVEELTGRSLDDPRARAELWVARQLMISAGRASAPRSPSGSGGGPPP